MCCPVRYVQFTCVWRSLWLMNPWNKSHCSKCEYFDVHSIHFVKHVIRSHSVTRPEFKELPTALEDKILVMTDNSGNLRLGSPIYPHKFDKLNSRRLKQRPVEQFSVLRIITNYKSSSTRAAFTISLPRYGDNLAPCGFKFTQNTYLCDGEFRRLPTSSRTPVISRNKTWENVFKLSLRTYSVKFFKSEVIWGTCCPWLRFQYSQLVCVAVKVPSALFLTNNWTVNPTWVVQSHLLFHGNIAMHTYLVVIKFCS